MTAGRSRRLALVASVAILGPFASCTDDWETLPIRSYDVEGEVRVRVEGHCRERGRVVVVDEDAARVEVRLEISGESRGDCLDCPAATLDEPLDDRAVIDASTGEPVPFVPELC